MAEEKPKDEEAEPKKKAKKESSMVEGVKTAVAAVVAATLPATAESRNLVTYDPGNYVDGKQRYSGWQLMFMILVIVGAITTLFGIFKLVQRLWREMGYEVMIVRKTTMQATGVQAEMDESSWDEIIVVGRFETEVYHRGNCSALTIARTSKKLRRCLKCIDNPKDD